ncbi:MAG: hypothetical protein ACYS6W_15720, partial [Planctomycetota bacterium]
IQARSKAEDQAQTEASQRAEAEAKAESETAARLEAEQRCRAEAQARSEAEKEIIKIADVSRKRAKCECCNREYLGEDQLVRIDSGQMFCFDCLEELKSAVML